MSRTVLSTKTAPKPPAKAAIAEKPQESWRDLIEQLVFAVIVAVLIRGFDVEAFVIPTGSMAPTLMGRHKEVTCPQCGHTYAFNASDDTELFILEQRAQAHSRLAAAEAAPSRLAEAETYQRLAVESGDRFQVEQAADRVRMARDAVEEAPRRIEEENRYLQQLRQGGVCVNCRFYVDAEDAPSFKGDRILVMKFPYELPTLPGSSGPKRWDVVVFHYPEKPETNYIKRLVGLPEEELRIVRGDIQARPSLANTPFQIQRKPLIHQQAMQILVYDDNHRAQILDGKPEWRRWNIGGSWREDAIGRFSVTPDGEGWSALRYRHLIPDPEQWVMLLRHGDPPRGPRPTLITDFYSYNTNVSPSSYSRWSALHDRWLQSNWVGDLTVSCHVDLDNPQPGAVLQLELIEAGVSNRCEVDLISGVATLYHGQAKLGESGTVLRGIGSHDVKFANVDDRLTLWIDGVTPFDEGLAYEDGPDVPYFPTAADLDPVGVAIKKAKARVSGLVLKRDIYYTQDAAHPDYKIVGVEESMEPEGSNRYGRVIKMFDFLADPTRFAALKDLTPHDPYLIRPDHFMMMGDNSPRSSDSRQWDSKDVNWREADRSSWEVPRQFLIGKAFYAYWPHAKPFGPDIRLYYRDWQVPFRPYFERMKWIR